MLVIIAPVFYCFQVTIQAVHLAAGSLAILTLELDRCMADMILFVEHGSEGLQDRGTAARREILDERMARERIHAAGDTPDMQVVYILHTFNVLHIGDQRRERDIFGDGLHE